MLLVAVAAGALITAVITVVRPSLPTLLPDLAVWAAAAAGAVALALADTAPTGGGALDLVLRVTFGALVPLAAARAGTVASVWLTVVGVAVLFLSDAPAVGVAGVAAGALLALAAAGTATPAARAIAAAAVIGPLAHADWPLATGASAIAIGIATLPVLLFGLARTGRPTRGRITLALTVLVLVMVAGAVAGLLAALSARSDVDRAVDLATDGIDVLGDDDERARQLLYDAAGAFGSAEDTLTTWWARSALLVPGVAQQSRAVSMMASAGAELARTAADASEDADIDSVRPVDGRVDLVALEALTEPLDRSVSSLQRADTRLAGVDSPLLLTPLADRLDDLRRQIDEALGSAELASQAVDVAPGLLGADGPRRYFVAFQNSAELRGDGGFIGNWAEIVADGGRLELTRSGRSRDLFNVARENGATIEGEDATLAAWGPIVTDWVNVNFMGDHPTVSRFISQLYPQSGGAEVDGVFAVTPSALAGFLELTGPIEAPGYPQQLTSENAERILLHEQYLEFPQEAGEDREAFLSGVVEVLFDRLTTGELPGPRAIATELGPAVEGRHLQLWSKDDAEQALFDRLGATGSIKSATVDSFGVFTTNFSGNKIDWFLHREIEHDVEWDPRSGEVEGTITVRFRNDAPATGLPRSIIGWGGDLGTGARPVPDGENFMQVNLYTAFPVESLTVDGSPVEEVGRYQELGHELTRFYLEVPSESVREVVARVRGVVEPAGTYTVRALRQPTVNPDQVSSAVRIVGDLGVGDTTAEGVDLDGKRALTRADATEPFEMVVHVERSDEGADVVERLRGDG